MASKVRWCACQELTTNTCSICGDALCPTCAQYLSGDENEDLPLCAECFQDAAEDARREMETDAATAWMRP